MVTGFSPAVQRSEPGIAFTVTSRRARGRSPRSRRRAPPGWPGGRPLHPSVPSLGHTPNHPPHPNRPAQTPVSLLLARTLRLERGRDVTAPCSRSQSRCTLDGDHHCMRSEEKHHGRSSAGVRPAPSSTTSHSAPHRDRPPTTRTLTHKMIPEHPATARTPPTVRQRDTSASLLIRTDCRNVPDQHYKCACPDVIQNSMTLDSTS